MIVVRVFSEDTGKETCWNTILSGSMEEAKREANRLNRMKNVKAVIEVT